MTELGGRGCAFGYEVRDPGGVLLAEGATHHVFTDTAGRPRRAGADVLTTLGRFRLTAPAEERA